MPAVMRYGPEEACDSTKKAELLNWRFVSVFGPRQSDGLAGLPSPPSDVPTLTTVTCSEINVFNLHTSMRENVASGPDDISSKMLRKRD